MIYMISFYVYIIFQCIAIYSLPSPFKPTITCQKAVDKRRRMFKILAYLNYLDGII